MDDLINKDKKKCLCGSPKKREQNWCNECHAVRSSGKDYARYFLKKTTN